MKNGEDQWRIKNMTVRIKSCRDQILQIKGKAACRYPKAGSFLRPKSVGEVPKASASNEFLCRATWQDCPGSTEAQSLMFTLQVSLGVMAMLVVPWCSRGGHRGGHRGGPLRDHASVGVTDHGEPRTFMDVHGCSLTLSWGYITATQRDS